MHKNTADRGLISVFQIYASMRLVLAVFTMFSTTPLLQAAIKRVQPAPFLTIAETGLLVLYLSLDWLRERLGRLYLPLALLIASVAPVFENALTLEMRLSSEVNLARALANQWQLILLLLVPLILVSWRYPYPVTIVYCLGLLGLDGWVLFWLSPDGRAATWTMLLSVIVFRTLIYLLAGFILSRLANEQRRQNAQLLDANRQLEHYTATMEQLAISRERNRLAREMHDTLAHSLSALAVQLEAVHALWDTQPPQARAMLEQSLQLTRSGLAEARRAIQSLRSTPLEDLGLRLALKNLAQSIAERSGIGLDLQLPDEVRSLSPEIEQCLFRVAEEALRNIAEHAAAQHIWLHLRQDAQLTWLEVGDDGQGFDAQQNPAPGHFGLHGMKERAAALGGKLSIFSQPGKGTRVQLMLEE